MNQQPMMPQAPAPTQQPMAPAPWEPKSMESPLERAFDTLGGKLGALEKAVSTLIERVGPALAPLLAATTPSQPCAKMTTPPPCSDVVKVVHGHIDKLNQLLLRVESITSRVEL